MPGTGLDMHGGNGGEVWGVEHLCGKVEWCSMHMGVGVWRGPATNC